MHYNENELIMLERALLSSSFSERKDFFTHALSLHRKERAIWLDTPIARIFTPSAEWHLLRPRATAEKIGIAVTRAIKARKRAEFNPYVLLRQVDKDEDGYISLQELSQFYNLLNLDFSPGDYSSTLQLFPATQHGIIVESVPAILRLPSVEQVLLMLYNVVEEEGPKGWKCEICTLRNSPEAMRCGGCGLTGPGGLPPAPEGHWQCPRDTLYNKNEEFFCSACQYGRPDYAKIRF